MRRPFVDPLVERTISLVSVSGRRHSPAVAPFRTRLGEYGDVMLTGQLALITAAVFAGAALYISAVEQPARLGLDNRSLLTEWKPAYKRGTAMQAPLAIGGFVLGLLAWWQTGHLAWVLGALFMIANWPVTYFVIMPTNNKLMEIDPATAGLESRAMIERWGSLHQVRTALGFAASLSFLWASLSLRP